MPRFLYDLPEWQMGALVVTVCVVLALVGFVAARKLFPTEIPEEQRGLSLTIMGMVATINSLLLAFSAVSVWESFGGAEGSVADEANTASELARDLGSYDTAEARAARVELEDYVKEVIEKEWPAMANGEASTHAWDEVDDIFRTVAKIQPANPAQVALLPEIWARVNELVKNRRNRIEASEAEVPASLWLITFLGTAITFALLYVLPLNRFNTLMIASMAASMGLVFFFIIAMDHPFLGKESVSAEPFEMALKNMEHWGTATQPGVH